MGGRLARALQERGAEVRGLVRDAGRGRELEREGVELHEGDVLDAASIRGAGEGADVAYYLVHGMGRGSNGDFTQRERAAASNFARMAKEEGVERVVYLGGLGEPASKHLRSRHETVASSAPRARRSPTSAPRWSWGPVASPTAPCATWCSAFRR